MAELRSRVQRLPAIGAVGILAAASLVLALPTTAGAEEPGDGTCSETHLAVTGGSFSWGVKESWRSYLQGSVAKGGWKLDDVRDTGSAFSFTPEPGAGGLSRDGSGVIPFEGSVTFQGHNGALDMTLSDVALVVDGSEAAIRADYRTYESDMMASGKKGDLRTGDDVTIAEVNLDRAARPDATSFSLRGATTLSAGGAELFQAYDAGTAMDPTGGTLTLKTACGPAPGGSGAGSGGGAGTAKNGMGGLLAGVNDTFSEVNKLLGNTSDFFDNAEDLHGRVWADDSGNSGVGTGGTTGTTGATGAGATTTTGTTTATGTAAGTTTTGTTAVGTTAAGTSTTNSSGTTTSGDVCTADTSRGITQAEASWGVRSSFLNYLSGSIANGGWELSGVGHEGGQFLFSGDAGAVDPQAKSGTILFPGTMRFTGHGGVLDTRFSNLEIQFSGGTGALLLNASSNSTEGEPNDYGRVTLGNLNFTSLNVNDSEAAGTAEVILTEAGARAFGDFYPAGDALDPITFRAALGGGASCAAGQGAAGTTTAGGSGDAGRAAELRSGDASTGTDAASASGSVFDEASGEDVTTSAGLSTDENGNQFRIKSAGADSGSGNDRLVTLVLLIVAAFVVAGASLSSFGRRNPTVG